LEIKETKRIQRVELLKVLLKVDKIKYNQHPSWPLRRFQNTKEAIPTLS